MFQNECNLLNVQLIKHYRFQISFYLLLTAIALTACQEKIEVNFANQPVQTIKLGSELNEISALCVYNENKLAAVQDEKGEIFLIDVKEKSSLAFIKFKEKGDFEGLAFDGEVFYALGSDGDIFQVDSTGDYARFAFQAQHKKKYDFEGLTFDQKGSQLLVLCKKHGKKKEDSYLWIYRFDLDQMEYIKTPFLKIKKSSLNKSLKASGLHIQDDELWILSAATNQLFQLKKDGKLLSTTKLDRNLYPQAEGICITSDNSIYIATEKKHKSAAYIHQLKLD